MSHLCGDKCERENCNHGNKKKKKEKRYVMLCLEDSVQASYNTENYIIPECPNWMASSPFGPGAAACLYPYPSMAGSHLLWCGCTAIGKATHFLASKVFVSGMLTETQLLPAGLLTSPLDQCCLDCAPLWSRGNVYSLSFILFEWRSWGTLSTVSVKQRVVGYWESFGLTL